MAGIGAAILGHSMDAHIEDGRAKSYRVLDP